MMDFVNGKDYISHFYYGKSYRHVPDTSKTSVNQAMMATYYGYHGHAENIARHLQTFVSCTCLHVKRSVSNSTFSELFVFSRSSPSFSSSKLH